MEHLIWGNTKEKSGVKAPLRVLPRGKFKSEYGFQIYLEAIPEFLAKDILKLRLIIRKQEISFDKNPEWKFEFEEEYNFLDFEFKTTLKEKDQKRKALKGFLEDIYIEIANLHEKENGVLITIRGIQWEDNKFKKFLSFQKITSISEVEKFLEL